MIGQLCGQVPPSINVQGVGQSVGATTADLITIPIPTGKSWAVTATVIGAEATPSNAYFKISQLASNRAGTVQLVGTLGTLVGGIDLALTGCLCILVASAGNLIVRVTGVTAKTINWTGVLTIEVQA